MLTRSLQLAKKTAVLLLVLWTQQAPPAVADSDALEFRHGVSQIPNYKLKYPRGFTHFDYVNVEAPKGGALVLPTAVPLDSVTLAWLYGHTTNLATAALLSFHVDRLERFRH